MQPFYCVSLAAWPYDSSLSQELRGKKNNSGMGEQNLHFVISSRQILDDNEFPWCQQENTKVVELMSWWLEDISKVVSGWKWDWICREKQFCLSDKWLHSEERETSAGQTPPILLQVKLDVWSCCYHQNQSPSCPSSASTVSVVLGEGRNGMAWRRSLFPNLSSPQTSLC